MSVREKEAALLIEHETNEHLRREEAAARLREIADELARQNEISFVRGGITHTVKVPDDITFEFEVEIGEDGSEIELSLKWS